MAIHKLAMVPQQERLKQWWIHALLLKFQQLHEHPSQLRLLGLHQHVLLKQLKLLLSGPQQQLLFQQPLL